MSAAGEKTEGGAEQSPAAPLVRVVSGDPTPEELAAVIAVLAARAGGGDGAEDGADRSPSRWTDRTRGVRTPLHPGPGGWRASAFPLPR